MAHIDRIYKEKKDTNKKELIRVPIKEIKKNIDNFYINDTSLEEDENNIENIENIKLDFKNGIGLLNPIKITNLKNNQHHKYLLIDGECRLRALEELGQKEIDCYIDYNLTENEIKKQLIIANEHTRNLSEGQKNKAIIELYNILKEEPGSKDSELFKKIAKLQNISSRTVERKIIINKNLHQDEIEAVERGEINIKTAEKIGRARKKNKEIPMPTKNKKNPKTEFKKILNSIEKYLENESEKIEDNTITQKIIKINNEMVEIYKYLSTDDEIKDNLTLTIEELDNDIK